MANPWAFDFPPQKQPHKICDQGQVNLFKGDNVGCRDFHIVIERFHYNYLLGNRWKVGENKNCQSIDFYQKK